MNKASFECNYKLARIRVPREKCGRIMTSLIDALLTGVPHNIGLQHNIKLYKADGDVNTNRRAVGWIVGIGYEGDIGKDRKHATVRFDTLCYLPKVPEMATIIEHVKDNHYGIAFSKHMEEDNSTFKHSDDIESITIVCMEPRNAKPAEPAKTVNTTDNSVNLVAFTVKAGTDMDVIMKTIEAGYPVGEYFASKEILNEKLHERAASMIGFQTIEIENIGPVVKSLEKIPGVDDAYDYYMMTYLDDDIQYGRIEVQPRMIGNPKENKYKAIALDVYSVSNEDSTDVANGGVCFVRKDITDPDYSAPADATEEGIRIFKKSTFDAKQVFRIEDDSFKFSDIQKTYESYNQTSLGLTFMLREEYDKFISKLGCDDDVTELYNPDSDPDLVMSDIITVNSIDYDNGSKELIIAYNGPESTVFMPRYHGFFLVGFDAILFENEAEMNAWKEKYSIQ